MALLTYDDWIQWKARGAIESCDGEVRARFEHFVTRHVATKIGNLPAWERSRLGDYLENNAAGRQRCATEFDAHMSKEYVKGALFRFPPKNSNPTREDYAAAWSAYARTCIFRDVVRRIMKDVKAPPGHSPVEFDREIGEDDTTTRLDVTPAGGSTVEDLISPP